MIIAYTGAPKLAAQLLADTVRWPAPRLQLPRSQLAWADAPESSVHYKVTIIVTVVVTMQVGCNGVTMPITDCNAATNHCNARVVIDDCNESARFLFYRFKAIA